MVERSKSVHTTILSAVDVINYYCGSVPDSTLIELRNPSPKYAIVISSNHSIEWVSGLAERGFGKDDKERANLQCFEEAKHTFSGA